MEKQYYLTKEQFTSLSAAWKARRHHTGSEHIIYNILRSKSAKLGFCERTTSVQNNDTWYGFHTALQGAKAMCNTANKMERYRGNERYAQSVQAEDDRIKARLAYFKGTFGIELPADLLELLGAQ